MSCGHLRQLRAISVLANVTPRLPAAGHRGIHGLGHGDGIFQPTSCAA